jgi:hypothetical protein
MWFGRSMPGFYIAALPFTLSSAATGQIPKRTIEKGLESQYALTVVTADNSDIVAGGAVLTLLKRGLLAADASAKGICVNTFKEGQIKPGAACQLMGGKTILGQHVGGTIASRVFVNGEKVFVTKVDVDRSKDLVAFDLFSDVYNNVRYRATLRFEFPKGSLATADFEQVQPTLNQVFTVTPPDTAPPASAASSKQQITRPPVSVAPDPPPRSPAQPPAVQPDAPPPPPPADPASIALGDTTDQVVAKMGQPQRIVKAAAGKEFYFYKDIKVTFVNGKMTDAE